MGDDLQQENSKLIVTSRGLQPLRVVRSALRSAVGGARVHSTGFRGIFALAGAGDAIEIAQLLWRQCGALIGHVTVVLCTVESNEQAISDAAVHVGVAQISAEESFSFRLHKRGAHGLTKDTSMLEPEIGAAICRALEVKHRQKPKVNLDNPDVTVVAEVLGPMADVGVWRAVWCQTDQLLTGVMPCP